MVRLWSTLLHPKARINNKSNGRRTMISVAVPFMCLLIYSLSGAWLIYVVDSASGSRNLTEEILCVKEQGFLGALFYINTIYTTIGYGTVIVCNEWAKLLTIVLAFVGIPLFLVALDSFGKMICHFLRTLYVSTLRLRRSCFRYVQKGKCNRKAELELQEQEKYIRVPMSIVLFIDTLWIILCTAYFSELEHWEYLDSFYFTFMSLFTIGFGDLAPSNLSLTPLSFSLLVVGLSLISTTINMVLLNIQALMGKLHLDIEREYQHRLQQEAEYPYLAKQERCETGEETIARLITENSATALASLISTTQLANIAVRTEERNSQQSTGTQTVPITPKPTPGVKAQCAQTHSELLKQHSAQTEPPIQTQDALSRSQLTLSSISMIEILPIIQCEMYAQTAHTTSTYDADTARRDVSVNARPSLRSAILQTPTCWSHRASVQFSKSPFK